MRTDSITARAMAVAFALSATAALAQVPTTKYVVTDLGSLDGSIGTTIAQGINNAGQVVGTTRFGPSFSDPSRAFRTAPNRPIQPADNLGCWPCR
jgi:probable HAF family extracellular repeat protein